MQILRFDADGKFNDMAFLEVYKGSSKENAPSWYPDLSFDAALEKYELSFLEYMHGQFWQEGGILFLLADETGYRRGLRLYKKENNRFYLEALETRPDSRRRGLAKLLLRGMFGELKKEFALFTAYDEVYKSNTASINTHMSAGFTKAADYAIKEDGTHSDKEVMFEHTNG